MAFRLTPGIRYLDKLIKNPYSLPDCASNTFTKLQVFSRLLLGNQAAAAIEINISGLAHQITYRHHFIVAQNFGQLLYNLGVMHSLTSCTVAMLSNQSNTELDKHIIAELKNYLRHI